MKTKIYLLVASFLLVAAIPRYRPAYDICIKSDDCQYIVYYNQSGGQFDLQQYGVSIVSGTGTVAIDGSTDEYKLIDNSNGHKFKIIVNLDTGVATVTYKQGTVYYVNYSSLRDLSGCPCGP